MVRVVVALLILMSPASAFAAQRIALLIGNQKYNAKVGPLKNPHNDITIIGAALRSLKFTVTEIKDADYGTIDKAINRHVQAVRRAGQGTISLVYYAGHGAANPDTKINYLIPVDVGMQTMTSCGPTLSILTRSLNRCASRPQARPITSCLMPAAMS